MFLFLYSSLLTLVLIVSSPWWLWRMATTNRYREGLRGRLGAVPPALRHAITGRRVIWLHAVSVGELLAAERLIHEFQLALPTHVIVVSTTTATGQKLARERFSPALVFYLPLDFAAPVRRYLNALRPDLLILMESELWPRLLAECNRRHIPIAVANARISDRSFPRYMALRALWRPILGRVTLFLAQSEETAQRLRRIGAPPDRIQTPGNLKYDLARSGPNAMTLRVGRLLGSSRLMVAGSTLEGEEELLLAAWPRILRGAPDAILAIAPRHPQRFDEVAGLIMQSGAKFRRASQLPDSVSPDGGGWILLLDTLGDLASLYSKAKVAFIGGSLVPRGGHNPLEAARFGVPIVMGKSYENFREIVEGMNEVGAIHLVERKDLDWALINAPRYSQRNGKRGRDFYKSRAGATARTVAALLPLLSKADA